MTSEGDREQLSQQYKNKREREGYKHGQAMENIAMENIIYVITRCR
jgi:hypothetical protein